MKFSQKTKVIIDLKMLVLKKSFVNAEFHLETKSVNSILHVNLSFKNRCLSSNESNRIPLPIFKDSS